MADDTGTGSSISQFLIKIGTKGNNGIYQCVICIASKRADEGKVGRGHSFSGATLSTNLAKKDGKAHTAKKDGKATEAMRREDALAIYFM
jgi:hypothetical protein